MNAQEAIRRSISHTEIVTIDWDTDVVSELESESSDSAKADAALEFWGTDDDGDEWRVHVSRPDFDRDAVTNEDTREENGE